MKKLLFVLSLVVMFFMVGINYPTYTNSYGGETVGDALLGGVASCAAINAWDSIKQKDAQQQQPVPTQSPVYRSQRTECYNMCDRRFPSPSQANDFNNCINACR